MSTPPNYTPVLSINSKTIAAIVGIIAIITATNSFFDTINTYKSRLDKVEFSDSIRSNEIKSLTSELKSLNTQLTDLVIELKEMKAANEALKLKQ